MVGSSDCVFDLYIHIYAPTCHSSLYDERCEFLPLHVTISIDVDLCEQLTKIGNQVSVILRSEWQILASYWKGNRFDKVTVFVYDG